MTAAPPERAVTLTDVLDAARRIAGRVQRTPTRLSPFLSGRLGGEVRLKLETMQDTGAFKIRGATNALMSLPEHRRRRGVVAVSTGNHGRAVAHAARALGVPCTVFMSSLVPEVKVRAIRDLGAEVVIAGASQDKAEEAALARIDTDSLSYIHPFDQAAVIAGQGTIALELLQDMPDVATVVIPLSGGGLVAGIGIALKTLKPNVRIVGVSMQRGAAMACALENGHPVPVEEVETLADSLGGGIGLDNRHTFHACRRVLDEVILLSEDEIADAMRILFLEDRIVAEGGGAVGVGALLSDRLQPSGGPIAIVVSGCNVDMGRFLEIVAERPDTV